MKARNRIIRDLIVEARVRHFNKTERRRLVALVLWAYQLPPLAGGPHWPPRLPGQAGPVPLATGPAANS